ncbi:MAG: signal peptidase I [Candidatus Sulfotelmatobacter sp.]
MLTTKPSGVTKRHLFAALFSALVPGAGQLFLGQRRKAVNLLLIFAALLVGFWPLRFLRFYTGFLLLYCCWIALYLYAVCSAHRSRDARTGARPSSWWLVVILPLTVLTLSLLGAIVTRAAGFRSFKVPSTSMEKTIVQGDQIVADMRYYHSRSPDREDVVLFERQGTVFIKRVIAIGSDTIQGKGGDVFVNGTKIFEPYIQHTSQSWAPDWTVNFGPVKVENGDYFVMGDNRDFSLDSRSPNFGIVDRGSVVGKPLYVFDTDRPGKGIR